MEQIPRTRYRRRNTTEQTGVCNKSTTTGANSVAGTTYLSEAHGFTLVLE